MTCHVLILMNKRLVENIPEPGLSGMSTEEKCREVAIKVIEDYMGVRPGVVSAEVTMLNKGNLVENLVAILEAITLTWLTGREKGFKEPTPCVTFFMEYTGTGVIPVMHPYTVREIDTHPEDYCLVAVNY